MWTAPQTEAESLSNQLETLEAKDRLDEGRGKTGMGDMVGWKGESQEGGEGRRMTSRRYRDSFLYLYYNK
jgi:hypothetical protein